MAAADPGAVLRARLDRRAHRHQASAARVARAAAVVFPRPQFPAERAARQGDRVVHRGGQGRSADHRPALRARLAVPPAGRDRPRDPHAPEPARPARPVRPTSARPRPTSSRRTSTAPGCSTAPRSSFTSLDGTPFEHAALGHLISIYETEKDWPKAIAATQRMEELAKQPYFKEIAQYHCELAQAALLRSDTARPHAELDGARDVSRLRARNAGGRRSRAQPGNWRGRRGVAEDRVAESGVPLARRGPHRRCVSPARRPRAGHAPAAQLPGAISVARRAQRALLAGARARRAGGRGDAHQGRARAQSRRCSASTACSRRSCSRRPRSGATTSSSSRDSSASTSSGSACTSATTAASARSSTTGVVPVARSGKRIRRGARRRPTGTRKRGNMQSRNTYLPKDR